MQPGKGHVIARKYTLQEVIGQGGAGTVWKAHHEALRTHVAIKLLSNNTSDEMVIRFYKEAQAAARMRSPNVVQVSDCGVDDGHMFIVMELLEGEDLREHIHRLKRLEPEDVFRIVRQLARVLRKAHAAGIVHRDLKPGNIFLARHDDIEVVKILDFGIVKCLFEQGITAPGTVIGTPAYMSPEQARGSIDLDGRADLWSLAVIAYRMLTGALPFPGPTGVETIQAVLRGRFIPPSQHLPELGPEVDAFFERALAASAADRFQDANSLCTELGRALDLEPRSSSADGEWEMRQISETNEATTGALAAPSVPDVASPRPSEPIAGAKPEPSPVQPSGASAALVVAKKESRRASGRRSIGSALGDLVRKGQTPELLLLVLFLLVVLLLVFVRRPKQGVGALRFDPGAHLIKRV